jgi:large subunit ribosomal protein L1
MKGITSYLILKIFLFKMGKISKKRAAAEKKIQAGKLYSLEEAMALIKEVNIAKFDASVDLHIRLGVDPRKADQNLRGTISLPHGTGKDKKVLALCTPDKEEEAKAAGADFVGLDEYLTKMQGGWLEMDVIVAMANVMPKLGRLGRV